METRTSVRLGVAISTHGRYETFKKSYDEWVRLSPEGTVIVVVDDASTIPVEEATFRFNENQGIARTKNKCLELLDNAGCEHFILSDDDTWPIKDNWWKPYVESKEPHLMYIFQDFIKPRLHDTTIVYQDSNIIASSHPRGCMLYYSKECLRKVGGMDPIFGRWGYEHGDLSNRIFNSGLTSFRYMDVPNSRKLFYSADEHEAVETTVKGLERVQQIRANKDLAASRKYSAQYVPYKDKLDIVITTFFTGVADPQRPGGWNMDEAWKGLHVLIDSLISKNVSFVVLYDKVPYNTIHFPQFVKVETSINPYFQRWVSIMQYLRDNRERIGKVFCVDATDVEMLKNPFPEMDENFILCGSEEEKLNCTWMVRHHQHPVLQKFFNLHRARTLLNAGLLGGSVDMVIGFCSKIIDMYSDLVISKEGPGMTDMGIFNYVMVNTKGYMPVYGEMVHTKFKGNERNNISFWKHK